VQSPEERICQTLEEFPAGKASLSILHTHLPSSCIEVNANIRRLLRLGSIGYGHWKEEAGLANNPIACYTSLGTKTYAITQQSGLSIVKCEGLSLGASVNQASVNPESMRKLLMAWAGAGERRPLPTTAFQMRLNCAKQSVHNSRAEKRLANDTYNKRWLASRDMTANGGVNPCVNTYPHGLQHFDFPDVPPSSRAPQSSFDDYHTTPLPRR